MLGFTNLWSICQERSRVAFYADSSLQSSNPAQLPEPSPLADWFPPSRTTSAPRMSQADLLIAVRCTRMICELGPWLQLVRHVGKSGAAHWYKACTLTALRPIQLYRCDHARTRSFVAYHNDCAWFEYAGSHHAW